MTERDLASFTAADLDDSRCDETTVAQLAQGRPDLWPAIRRHPKCYPELAAWIDRQLPPPPAAAPAPLKPTADEWAARFQQANGREPSMSEYQAALAGGDIRKPQDASVQQMTAGAKQLATGAKDFLSTRVAPAAAGAARSVQQAVKERAAKEPHRGRTGPGSGNALGWAPIALPVAAFLAILSLFLPIASGGGYNVNYFHPSADGQGAALLTVMLVLLGAAIAALVIRVKWSRIVAGAAGVLVGLGGMLWGIAPMAGANDYSGYGISVGMGAVLLTLCSAAMVVAGVVTLIGLRRPAAASTPAAPSWPAPSSSSASQQATWQQNPDASA